MEQLSTLKIGLLSALTSAIVSGVMVFSITLRAGTTPAAAPASPAASETSSSPQSTVFLSAQETSVISAVRRAEPAVVSIGISKNVRIYNEEEFFPFFEEFDTPPAPRNGTENREIGQGTAFFVSSDGLLMTNKHVVADPKAEYTVILKDGQRLPATILALDPTNDIALLKITGKDFPFLTISEDPPLVGQTVIAIGNALGEFGNTVSTGVISGLQRSITAGGPGGSEQLSRIIQTDAAINQGNSGGPLLNLRGRVVGMNTALAGGAQNIGFAIPAEDLRKVLESYRTHGRIVKPYLGVRYVQITKSLREKNNLPYDYGVLAVRGETREEPAIMPGSPAHKAGLEENDIILEADGRKLTQEASLSSIIQSKFPGDAVRLKIAHRGQEKEITVTLEEWKET